MAARTEVIVRVQWADPERSGLRTLRLRARSLDRVCKGIAKGVGGLVKVDDTACETEPPAPTPMEVPGNGVEHGPIGTGLVAATIESVGQVPPGHLLPATTLLRVRANRGRVFLRLIGAHDFELGTRIYLSGLEATRTMYDAELVSGAVTAPFFFELRPWS